MLRISQIKIPVKQEQTNLENKICGVLKVNRDSIREYHIVRKSVEARRHEELSYVYSVDVKVRNESEILKKNRNRNITVSNKRSYTVPKQGDTPLKNRPVIIGSGPAGLFAAYLLAKSGFRPLVIERGDKAEERRKSVERFWAGEKLDPQSNVQFGEGGAGTFSDGKLNTGVNDKEGRISYVLETFVKYGAQENITYDAKPHVGTDVLYDVIRNMRNAIIDMGGEFRFRTCLDDIVVKEDHSIEGLILSDGSCISAEAVIAAIGHSARDTVHMFYGHGIQMQPKSFAVGVRIQHPQKMINDSQWGEDAPDKLGAAPYKLTAKMPDGRGVYSFCMCPGGYVVNASSEEQRLAVNGMSYSGRNSGYANSALIVTVGPEDFRQYASEDTPDELSGIAFQRTLEEKAFAAGNGKIPVQRFGDFRNDRISSENSFEPCTKGEWTYADVRGIFPAFLSEDLTGGICDMAKKIRGFDTDDALLMGVESRTSSPVRINRNEDFECNISGLYPCGEGAGYAGGIVSAAVDGMKTAEKIIRKYKISEVGE